MQQEFAKFLMIGSGGQVEVAAPLTDDERRDYEIHERGRYSDGLAIQVKGSRHVYQRNSRRAPFLVFRFPIRATRVVNNPRYWYFLAHLDLDLMGLASPVFLVPSTVFHRQAQHSRRGAFWYYTCWASIGPDSHDKWRPYRVEPHQLGKRVLEILNDLRRPKSTKTLSPGPIPSATNAIWLRRAA